MVTIAAGFWSLVAIAWLTLMPREIKGKSWHYIHALVPFVPMAFYYFADIPALVAPFKLFITMGAAFFVVMVVLWMIGEKLSNHSFMDIGYAMSVLLIVVFCLVQSDFREDLGARHFTILALVALWSGRLLRHTIRTNFRVEAQPYSTLRTRYGSRWKVWSFFHVYMLQGTFLWIWSISFAFSLSMEDRDIGPVEWLGVAVWLTGYCFQAIGDWQLEVFKRNPANSGALMQGGLWSLTRHPNYFGEAVMWSGYFVFALSHPLGWIAIISPIYVAWFMGYGSATPGNERHMRKTRPDYEDYARRVPQFFPRFSAKKNNQAQE